MANEKNLVPFKPGDDPRRNTKGRPKGTKNLATIVRELENEEFDWSIIPDVGKRLQGRLGSLGAPWRAIVLKALTQALNGNEKAMEWLRKSGYGDKIDVTSGGKKIESPLIISPVRPRNVEDQGEAETGT